MHPKNIKCTEDMIVKYVEIPKKEARKVKILGISNLVDRVLQTQFGILLDPLIDVNIPQLFFGFRKGKNTHQAFAYLSNSINFSDMNRFHLLCIDISKYFDTISHEYILKHFPFPEKHKKLLIRWLKVIKVHENYSFANGLPKLKAKRKKLNAGVQQGSVLGPLISNVVLAKVFENFFDDDMFPKLVEENTWPEKNKSLEANRYIVSYADNMIMRVISKEEVDYAKKKAEKCLAVAEIRLNKEKTQSYDLSKKAKFDWLGYTFLIFPKEDVRYTKLVVRCHRGVLCGNFKSLVIKRGPNDMVKEYFILP
jgi:RNA-directed DNA polymerase